MDSAEIRRAFDDVFDQAVVFHGYADYLRDYDVFVQVSARPRTGIPPEYLRYRFTHCVRATVESSIPPNVWADSLDERLTDYEAAIANDLDGYVWGVKWQLLYPGMSLVNESTEASMWSKAVGLPFHEAVIETNGHNIGLVFSDLVVTQVPTGTAPFVVPPAGPDGKIPL
jgi:hypothetical protein